MSFLRRHWLALVVSVGLTLGACAEPAEGAFASLRPPGGAPGPSASFTEITNFPGLWAGPLEWADFNNDGKLDLFAGGWAPGGIPRTVIYRNLGGGIFTEIQGTGLPDLRNANGVVGDFNNDGNVDVLLSGQGDGFVLDAFSGTGATTFTGRGGLWLGMAFSVGWGDYNNDGALDISARANLFFGFASDFYRNTGHGTFVAVGDPLPSQFTAASWCDYDQDGFGDLLATSGNPGIPNLRRLFHNNHDGTFSDIGAGFAPDGSAAWGDFDNDGDPDLLLSGAAGNFIYRNQGSNVFVWDALGLPGSPAGSAVWGDFDNDGWLDVLVMGGGPTRVTKLFHNNSGTSFSDTGVNLPGADGPIRCADFDGDGDLDFAIAGLSATTGVDSLFKVFRNDIVAQNTVPAPPTGLAAIIGNFGRDLALSWNAAFDSNQSAGLTYNLRLGTRPGASDIFGPAADARGFRRLVGLGNCGGGLSRIFTNLPAGDYYWSVQAIDHAYAGSAFAPEASFVLARPTLSDIPDQTIFPEITNSIPFTVGAVGTPVDTLRLSASAADNTLLPSNGFAFTGTGTNRALLITPAHNRRGSTTVTVTVTDTNGATATDAFVVTVYHTFYFSLLNFPAGNTVWGDYDNNGFQDLLLLSSPVRLYRNNGDSTFTEVSAGLPASFSGEAAWGDFDGDGDLDLAFIGSTGSDRLTAIYRNNGDGTFTDIQAGLPGLTGTVAWGDFDNDGDLDLLVSGTTGLDNFYITDVYRNDHGVFTPTRAGLPIAWFGREPWGDYDRDGRLDLLLGTSVWRNNGDGTFTDIGANIEGVFGGSSGWGDFDNDGFLDIAVTGFNGPGPDARVTRVYHNNRDNTFSDIHGPFVPLSNSGLAWGDFDNDGWLDLVITGTTNYTGSTWVPALAYHNNGDGTFHDQFVEFNGGYGGIQWVDYDNDGALDLTVVLADINLPYVFQNATPKKNTPPTAPSGLGSLLLSNNDVRLAWSASLDAETTNAPGLSYNLRVGTTPGGQDVMSPQADLATGRRRVTARGHASSTHGLLRDLPRGTYYWSVQAVDPTFAGSAFGAESSFVISNARPTISTLPTQTVSHTLLSQPIAFAVGDFETASSGLLVTATSSNPNVIPDEAISLAGTGSNRIVQVRPLPNQIGSVTLTLVVTDAQGWTRAASLVVNVTNLPPSVSGLSNVTVVSGTPVPALTFQIGDAESAPDELSLLASSSNTNLVANTNLLLSGSGTNRLLQILPTPGVKGTSTLRVAVADSLGATATNSFVLRVGDFQPFALGLPDVQQGALDWGDFDNDGRLDLLLCGRLASGTSITRLYHNDGNGSFTDIGGGLPGISGTLPPTVSWGDFNADGFLDFVLAGGVTRLYRNNGNGTFTVVASNLPPSASAAWADYDNDGALDLVLAPGPVTPSVQLTRIYRNNGDGTFSNSTVVLPNGAFVAPADFDNDGDVDLALGAGVQAAKIVTPLLRNEGNRVFTYIDAGIQGVMAGSWAWGDYDQDGRLDLLLTGINGNSYYTRLYHNNDNNTFSLVATNLPGMNAGTGIWGDYDNDGRLDIFLSGISSEREGSRYLARLYHSDGGALFSDSGELLTGAYWSAAAFGDYDGDGRLDLVFCGTTNGLSNGSRTVLYRNASAPTNTPPSAPTGLTVLPGAILAWNSATDAQTTNSGGLTYNLRIGTNAGGAQVMSPHSDLVTGWRRIARHGNVGASTRWRANLPPGTYYWSVQAIDAAFAGSTFAPEGHFTIPRFSPTITSSGFIGASRFRLAIDAQPGVDCGVLVSENLRVWTVAGVATELDPGHFEFVDSLAPTTGRFYRVSSP